MVEQKIEFRKIRDFGENINDTFQFIRFDFKPLLKSFFAICAIFMLTQAILQGMVQSRYSFLWDMIRGKTPSNATMNTSGFFGVEYFLSIIVPFFTYVAMQVAVCAYIKSYVTNNGSKPSIDEVWNIFKKYFLKMLLFTLPVLISIILGIVLCIIPGIYLGVVLVPFIVVAMMEDTNFTDTYRRCFELIKDNFWISLALYFVVSIIYSLGSLFVGLIVSAIFGLVSYLTTKDVATTIGVITSFFNMFSLTFYVIFLVSSVLHYFSLAEMKDGSGILSRIDEVGNKKTEHGNIEEEY